MRVSFLIAGVLLAIGLIFAINYRTELTALMGVESAQVVDVADPVQVQTSPAEEVPSFASAPLVGQPQTQPQPEAAEPAADLPALADSDPYVRTQMMDWQWPQGWLQRDELVARGSSVLANAAQGQIPLRQLSFLVPAESFPVTQIGETYYWDRSAPNRYDSYIAALTRLPAERAALLFNAMSPLFDQALAQLGERRNARQLLSASITTLQSRINNLPQLPARVELLRPNVMFSYADPELEALPELDKLLLRIGVDNLSKINVYLSEIKEYL